MYGTKMMPARGQRTATNKAKKAKEGMMPAKKMDGMSNKMPPGLLKSMKAKAK